MHHILQKEGFNEKAIWSMHLTPFEEMQPLSEFTLDPELFDWLGFTMYSLKVRGHKAPLSDMLNYGYDWARQNYRKPIVIWEMGRTKDPLQPKWMKDAYATIKRRSKIKLAIWAEYPMFVGGTDIGDAAKPVYREINSDPYFINGPIELPILNKD